MLIHLMPFNLNHFSAGKQGLFFIINSFHIEGMNCQSRRAGVALDKMALKSGENA
ncbi:hypothetical protein HMPREF0208_03839 [Citrobacter koseri]|uniref:Uncharacterized protein n=1 Tax=Citrobacter koseri (strain ATCC BAA-895 / CDC 4225-83 / SGSC4696) TaxID=290338 RepID=A8AEK6_CITK8|nr:hypothetical protein CKO_00767 [Citrobacter koseri ATCC BAA-895]KWZ99108.1 hypothetical protein HMPREF3220_02519 [Citrobacter koseri]KWZ99474.1 hypothetical protein HMPREF3207_03810 [Citrobacter koseri]KXB41195.1 hypothetical protein HMPREF0208_03839 [Citrobacter koseri]